jgi:hypothetical protein
MKCNRNRPPVFDFPAQSLAKSNHTAPEADFSQSLAKTNDLPPRWDRSRSLRVVAGRR